MKKKYIIIGAVVLVIVCCVVYARRSKYVPAPPAPADGTEPNGYTTPVAYDPAIIGDGKPKMMPVKPKMIL